MSKSIATGTSPATTNTIRCRFVSSGRRLTNDLVSIFDGDRLVAEHSRLYGIRYRYSTEPAHNPDGDTEGVEVLTRDELLKRASSFGPATIKVITQILKRNEKAIPRGLHTARNVLVKLGNKHNKTSLEPACQQILEHNLAPNMQVIARIQTDTARNHQQQPAPPTAVSGDRARKPVDIDKVAGAVFIRQQATMTKPRRYSHHVNVKY